METKHDKFTRLAAARGAKAAHHISLIANLAGPNYDYSEQEARGLLEELVKAVDRVRDAFKLREEEPAPPATPPTIVYHNEGPYTRGWVVWALDTISRDPEQAREMLKKALKGEKYT